MNKWNTYNIDHIWLLIPGEGDLTDGMLQIPTLARYQLIPKVTTTNAPTMAFRSSTDLSKTYSYNWRNTGYDSLWYFRGSNTVPGVARENAGYWIRRKGTMSLGFA